MKSLSFLLTKRFLSTLLCGAALAACGGGSSSNSDGTAMAATLATPSHATTAATISVELCPGHSADVTGQLPASAAIQACIDQIGAGGKLELPAGIYLMTSQLKLAFPFTLGTAGLAGSAQVCTEGVSCATLKAAPTFADHFGLIQAGGEAGTDHVVLDHLTLDGNRFARLSSPARSACVAGDNAAGFNARVRNCTSCKMTYSASINALCGTGMEWRGNFATIENNIFANNGEHNTTGMWADGLTLHRTDDSSIQNNRMTDNTDVGLISFGSARTKIEGNVINQVGAEAFAAFMLDSLDTGDFNHTSIAHNKVSCSPGKCFFAVNIGPRPWYPSNPGVFGGILVSNTISGGTIGLNIGGTQAGSEAMYVGDNMIVGTYSSAKVRCRSVGSVTQSALSADPNSVVNFGTNYLNSTVISPAVQSTDHCIS